MRRKTAIVGAGNMGCAIAAGMLDAGYISASDLYLTNPDTSALDGFARQGCNVGEDNCFAVKEADAVILAVKPQILPSVLAELAPISGGKLFISIAAGVTLSTIESALPGCAVVRVMPNTPLMVGEGVSALCYGKNVSGDDAAFARGVFACAGTTLEIPEAQMNALTALTSSSVAYFARLIDDMCAWASQNGFDGMSEAELYSVVAAVAAGTAKIITEKGMVPAALVRAVTSPNGTTEAALKVFCRRDFDGAISEAMTACTRRADELSAN